MIRDEVKKIILEKYPNFRWSSKSTKESGKNKIFVTLGEQKFETYSQSPKKYKTILPIIITVVLYKIKDIMDEIDDCIEDLVTLIERSHNLSNTIKDMSLTHVDYEIDDSSEKTFGFISLGFEAGYLVEIERKLFAGHSIEGINLDWI